MIEHLRGREQARGGAEFPARGSTGRLELRTSAIAEGVSIDDYSTFRATRFSEPV